MQVLDSCNGCGICVPYCPQNAISISSGRGIIDANKCVECLICLDIGVCPQDALKQGENETSALKQRYGQMVDSVHGGEKRRTVDICDVKKCDVSPFLFPPDTIMLEIEAGRPLGGVTLGQLNSLRRLLFDYGLEPAMRGRHAAYLDPLTGCFPADKADIQILYLAQQVPVPLTNLGAVLDMLEAWSIRENVCITLNATMPPEMEIEARAVLEGNGRPISDRMKANLGLGKAGFMLNSVESKIQGQIV